MPAAPAQASGLFAVQRARLLTMENHGRVVELPSRPGPVIDFSPQLTGRQRYLWSCYGRKFKSVEQAEQVRAIINSSCRHMSLADAIEPFRSPRSAKNLVWKTCQRFLLDAESGASLRTHEEYAPRTIVHYEGVLRRSRPFMAELSMNDFFKPDNSPDNIGQITDGIMKTASKARQNIDAEAANKLLDLVNDFAAEFWKAKGVKTKKQSSNQAAGGEFVVPAE